MCVVSLLVAIAGGARGADGDAVLVVAAVSCEVRIRDTPGNLERIASWSRRAAEQGADLVLFPECSLHGWWQSRENRQFAEPIDGASIRAVTEIAKKHDLLIAVGMTERSEGRWFITHVLVGPDGVVGCHRKSALAGGESGEASVWDVGDDANVFDVDGFTVGMAICFESVHPQTCQALTASGAEVILAPFANGTLPAEILDPERKQRTWIWDRVRENHVWYVACDATPHDSEGRLQPGAAFAISPEGELVTCTPDNEPGEGMVVVSISKRSAPASQPGR